MVPGSRLARSVVAGTASTVLGGLVLALLASERSRNWLIGEVTLPRWAVVVGAAAAFAAGMSALVAAIRRLPSREARRETERRSKDAVAFMHAFEELMNHAISFSARLRSEDGPPDLAAKPDPYMESRYRTLRAQVQAAHDRVAASFSRFVNTHPRYDLRRAEGTHFASQRPLHDEPFRRFWEAPDFAMWWRFHWSYADQLEELTLARREVLEAFVRWTQDSSRSSRRRA